MLRFKPVAAAALFLLTLLGVISVSSHAAESTNQYDSRDFGALPEAECGEAIHKTIQAAIDSGSPAEVVLGAGTYRVEAAGPRGYCFPIQNARNLVIRGEGRDTKLIVTNPACGVFSLVLCQKITLRDLTIDYDPLPFCQGKIRAIDVEAGWFDLEIDDGYATPDAENFVKAQEPYASTSSTTLPATSVKRKSRPWNG